MELRLGRAHIGTLLDQPRAQAQGQVGGQLQVRQLQALAGGVGRRLAEVPHQLIALLGDLLLQGRQRRLGLGQGCLLGEHVGSRSSPMLNCSCTSWSASACSLMMVSVAVIWPRSEARLTAAMTTLVAK